MELCLPSVRYPSQSPFRNRTASIIRCAIAEPSGVPAPMGEKTQYKDGLFAKAFMTLFARKMEKFGSGNKGGNGRGLYDYESFVDVSKRVMQGRSRKEQQRVVREVLLSMLPPGAPAQFRKLFPPTRWAAEFNAALTVPFFDWLVGPSEVIEVEVNGVKQRSGVHIKKCRYLENSGCVGMCVNMCKLPTQDFFTNEFGLPLTMTPNFEDMSCEMVYGHEGAILVVDAGEGPLAQTKFVLAKALKYGLRPILLLNKVDRPSVSEERCNEVESLVFDLFANLGASEEQLDFPVLYASAKEGWASSTFTKDPSDDTRNMSELLDAIIRYVPPPTASLETPFQMLVSMMERDFYLGRILTGRISSGVIRIGDRVHGLHSTDAGVQKIEEGKVLKLMKKKGTSMVLIESAGAGDIISMAGLTSPSIGYTVANVEVMTALPTVELDPPTISMTFSVNDSPLAGRDGTHLTGGKIGDRLMAEAETNLAINVLPGLLSESYEVQGRGELQLGILIENMRREGFELSVSPPKVMYKTENGQKLEPLEEVTIEVNEEHVGLVMEALSHRRGEVVDMGPVPGNVGRTRMSLTCPSRGLVGYRSVFSSDTHGTGFMHRAFLTYAKYRGPLGNVRKGVLVSMGNGIITSHALMSLEARGILFVSPGMETYDGMIVGEHSRDTDLDINPVRTKELTNVRAAGKDENVRLSPPRLMTLEEAIGYVAADELIEVTPKAVRLRKRYLDANKRKAMRNKPKE